MGNNAGNGNSRGVACFLRLDKAGAFVLAEIYST